MPVIVAGTPDWGAGMDLAMRHVSLGASEWRTQVGHGRQAQAADPVTLPPSGDDRLPPARTHALATVRRAMRHHGAMPDRTAAVDHAWHAVRAAAPARRAGPPRGRLTFLGHSTVLIEIDDLRILTDPVLREGVGPVRRQVRAVLPELFEDLDAIFISHGHHDHLDPPSLRRIPGKPTVIVPRGFGAIGSRLGLGPVEEVEPGDHLTIDRVRFEVTYAEHSGRREPFGRPARRWAASCPGRGPSASRRHGPVPGDGRPRRAAGRCAAAGVGMGADARERAPQPAYSCRSAAAHAATRRNPDPLGHVLPAGMRRVAPGPFDEPGREFASALARLAPAVPVRVLALANRSTSSRRPERDGARR
jgi:hypothetical protein